MTKLVEEHLDHTKSIIEQSDEKLDLVRQEVCIRCSRTLSSLSTDEREEHIDDETAFRPRRVRGRMTRPRHVQDEPEA